MRSGGMRAAVVLGLVVSLIGVPGVLPTGPLATAQGLESPAPKPSEGALPSTESTDEQPSESMPAQPPAFPPSGAGPQTESGPGSESGAPTAAPQPAGSFTPPLPPLGAVVYENSLRDERVFKAGRCFGGKALSQYVGEGFKLRVMGPCFLLLDEAWITVPATGVTVGDGEVALDFKVVDGASRATVGLYVRSVKEQLIGVHIHPTRSEASLFMLVEGKQTDLAYRANLGSLLKPGDWNRLAMRVNGHNAWLLLNDEPVLHSGEVHADAGQAIVELIRDGHFEDEDETAVVFRDLQLSALEGGEPGRAPTGP